MRGIIRKFTCGHPEQMPRPVIWLFIESMCISFSAVAVYFAIYLIAGAFENPETIDFKGLWMVAAGMIGLMLLQFMISSATFFNTFMPATRHSAENKTAFIKKLRTLPLGYFLKKESGELINTFTGDFLAVEQSMVALFTGIFSVVFGCVVSAIFMFIFNPPMALALYASVPVTILIIALSTKINMNLSKANIEARDKTATYLNEYLMGMKTLKAYNQTGEGFDKLKNAYEHLRKVNLKGESIGGSLLSFASTFVRIGLPMMCFVGAYLILGGELGIVEYLGLLIIGTKILSPLITWVSYMVMLRSHYVSACRIDDIMQQNAMQGGDTTDSQGDIVFSNVNFSYKAGEQVLDNASFTLPAGKLTAIVGPSGGGKTTILRLLARFWDADNGQITCGNKSLSELDPERWISNISMVLQDVYLFHDTIRENILFGRKDATEDELISSAKAAGCHDFVMALPEGYDTVVGEGGNTLSGGEKQRISIARAILKNAPILLLDEPTASLDARNEVLVQNAISELVKGRTVIMIAHRLKTVQNAHQILVLDGGQVVENGTHKQLIQNRGIYSHMWQLQNQSADWEI